jgi:Tat protein translocase TatB subunit
MFDLGIQEIIIIFIVALIALGPEKLPEAGRKLGKLIGGFKAALYDVKSQISTEMHTDFNPLKDSLDSFNKDIVEEVRSLDKTVIKDNRAIDNRAKDTRVTDNRVNGNSTSVNHPAAPDAHNAAAVVGDGVGADTRDGKKDADAVDTTPSTNT